GDFFVLVLLFFGGMTVLVSLIGILLEMSILYSFFQKHKKPQSPSTAKPFFSNPTRSYRDEARHGKAFEGLLARYFK
ncbi:MAG: hypothetical protein IKM52_01995, partial [Clostridia bacterium]|nr:hypothetical protein [Clostridia bacterium]